MSKRNLYLIGFMCSGKSTVGAILANVLGRDFRDLDEYIEEREGNSPRDIILQQGEAAFREIETKALRDLSAMEGIVLALGGGAMARDENTAVLKESGNTVYLKTSVEHIYQRLKNKTDRPIYQKPEEYPLPAAEGKRRIKNLLGERQAWYEKADLIFDAGDLTVGVIVDRLAKIIKKNDW